MEMALHAKPPGISPANRANTLSILTLCLVPLLAHLPELIGWVHTYPLLIDFGLTLHPDSGVLPGRPFIDDNASHTLLSMGHLAAEDWLHGKLPWWNPYTGAGLPLASEMQPAAFFLPFILLLHFHAGMILLKLAMQVLAGLFCFAFLRQVGLARGPAVLGSVLFECNGTFARFSDAPMLPVAFLPLLLLGLEWARERASADRRGGEAMIALAIAFSLLAGFPEVALLDGLLGLAWGVFRMRGLTRKARVAFVLKVGAGGLAGLALAAPVLIPFLQDFQFSSVGDRGIKPLLPPRHLAGLLFPNIYGLPWANQDWYFWGSAAGYFSAATVFLGVLALFARGGSKQVLGGARWLLALWISLWLAASFGAPGITRALLLIPGFHELWFSRYCLPSVEFAFCVLAACALDDARSLVRPSVWGSLAVLGAICGLALLLADQQVSAMWRGGGPSAWFLALSVLWGVGSVLGMALLLYLPDLALRRLLIGGILCVDAIGLFVPTILAGLRSPEIFDAPITFLQANLGLQRAVSVDTALPPNVGALLGIGSLQYEYAPLPINWATFVHERLDRSSWTMFPGLFEPPQSVALDVVLHHSTLESLAVRYVVVPTSLPPFTYWAQNKTYPRVFHDGGIDIFELPNAAPYAEISGGPCQLTVIDREHMRATCDAPARLIRRELMFPGWTVRVNGQPSTIAAEGEIFQAVALPVGVSDIVWRYVPMHAAAIAVIFAAGVLALIVFVVRSTVENFS